MNFKPELVEKILAGQKTQTRRAMSENPNSPWYRGGCKLKRNHAYALCPGRGKHQVAKIIVTDVQPVVLGAITSGDAIAEGFTSAAEFRDYWTRMHGSFDPAENVWAITFHLMPPGDGPLWEGGT